jgi:hypothetical protein
MQWKYLSESDSVALIDAQRLSSAPTSLRPGANDTVDADLTDGTIGDVQMLETARQVGSYLDSDSEDSDIEKEKQISYDRALYREDYQVKTFSFLFNIKN